ncbi:MULTISPECIES: hypothetical protein [unclassified Curtobacterium]|uniref:hypothetical protein n=1 Tax=unclassified Curtobacterium TaxID=257496 RepID=UPI0008DDCAF2|nr:MULTISPECIES: hypothetical protein [unclassified Curtobacterium]OIH95016.1 hypothetical protein BIU92_06570 [Curtobacterium sp. MCBA15_003]OII12878.1 hypothetical protein BIU97_02790 [Curtobacterium sp. MCBA15_009]OII32177.1 hypothetical protein BIU94_02115 [Curtobacterium sp. MMLR14_006]
MTMPVRLAGTVLTVLTVAAALTACSSADPTPAPSASATEATDVTTSTPAPTPSETATTVPETPTPTPTSTASGSALAQHIYEQCSTGAADAGVRLTFTEDPSGYTAANGEYQLIYPFEFLDGHDDPYAIYNCSLTDDTLQSTWVGGGIGDSR